MLCKPISLCVDARMIRSSGIGTFLRNVLPYVSRPPFQVTLLVKDKELHIPFCKSLFFSAGLYSPREQLGFPFTIPRCDIFWSPHYNVPVLPIRSSVRIVTIHDACHVALPQYLSRMQRSYAKFLMGQAFSRSDLVIADSEFSVRELTKFFGGRKKGFRAIPLGVDGSFFSSRSKKKGELQNPYFLFVGNLKPHKNLKGLLEGYRLFSQKTARAVSLALVGKMSGLKNLDPVSEEISRDRSIRLLGEVPDEELADLYSRALALVHPSFYEGFGLTPLEAMSCGCPALVSNAASLPEVCGDAVLYFDPFSPSEIADRLLLIAENRQVREDLIGKGRDRALQFRWEATGEMYYKAFLEAWDEYRYRA